MLEWQFVGELERSDLDRFHRAQSEEEKNGPLQPFVHHDLVGGGVDLGDASLAPVEEADGGSDHLEGVGIVGRQVRDAVDQSSSTEDSRSDI